MSWSSFSSGYKSVINYQKTVIITFNKFLYNNGSITRAFFSMMECYQSVVVILNIDCYATAMIAIDWLDNQWKANMITSVFQTAFSTNYIAFWHCYFRLILYRLCILFMAASSLSYSTSLTCKRSMNTFLFRTIPCFAQRMFIFAIPSNTTRFCFFHN